MSKKDKTGEAKAARPKRRLISQVPPPIEPIQWRAKVKPRSNTKLDFSSWELQQKLSRHAMNLIKRLTIAST